MKPTVRGPVVKVGMLVTDACCQTYEKDVVKGVVLTVTPDHVVMQREDYSEPSIVQIENVAVFVQPPGIDEATADKNNGEHPYRRYRMSKIKTIVEKPQSTRQKAAFLAEEKPLKPTVPAPVIAPGMAVHDLTDDSGMIGIVRVATSKHAIVEFQEDAGAREEFFIELKNLAAVLAPPNEAPAQCHPRGLEVTVEDTADNLKAFPASARCPLAIALKIQQLQIFCDWLGQSADSCMADKEHWQKLADKLEEAFCDVWQGSKGEVEKFNYID